ncbi:MAG: ribosomal protein S18-alanine N-acetyltransferase [Christensenellales bacterium]|jgi:ribosomal-protein-alanine N-acetyltransferase
MTQLIFREMEKADAGIIAELERMCFTLPWSKKLILDDLKNPLGYYLVGVLDGKIVTYCGMWIIIDEAHITNIAVHPDYRRRGFGRAMMIEMMERAIGMGVNMMSLEVRKSNFAARAMYERLGYRQAGLRVAYYHDNDEDAIVMWNRDLSASLDAVRSGLKVSRA